MKIFKYKLEASALSLQMSLSKKCKKILEKDVKIYLFENLLKDHLQLPQSFERYNIYENLTFEEL